MIQLLPDKIKIDLNSGAFLEAIGVRFSRSKTNWHNLTNNGRPLRKNDNPVCHADGFGNIMSDKNCSLFFLTQDFADIITYAESGLRIKCGERFIQQKKFRF